MTDDHLTPEKIAAYLDRRLSDSERADVEGHLGSCPRCRSDLVATSARLSAYRRQRSVRRLGWTAAAAAAAVLILTVTLPPDSAMDPDGSPPLRGDLTEGVERFSPVSPVGPVGGDSGVTFLWHAADPTASYQLTLTDESGDVLWSAGTTDTALVLPGDVQLEPGHTYYWFVDALLEDGNSATTGVQEFAVEQ